MKSENLPMGAGRSIASRATLLRSSEEYYRAVRDALIAARHSVYISAWDIHSQIALVPDSNDDYPIHLGPLLEALVGSRPELSVYLSLWDYSVIYLNERENPRYWKQMDEHYARFNFQFDDELPLTASQHEKVVVIDRKLAFCGGLDLSIWRWDTTAHHFHDERRVNPDGESYPPIHDTQLMLEGPIVDHFVDNFHYRWKRAGGYELPTDDDPIEQATSLWPQSQHVDFENVTACLYRTRAPYKDFDGLFECEELMLRSIECAEKLIFIENQYYSSEKINDALKSRLKEKNGPEVVMILTEDTNGWMEEGTMGLARDYLLYQLRESDHHDRLRVLYTRRFSDDGQSKNVYIHSKIHSIDDRIFKVGSTNLTNRSMKVDTECDIAIHSDNPCAAVRQIRLDLLGIHSGCPATEIKEICGSHRSFVAAVDTLVEKCGGRLAYFPKRGESEIKQLVASNIELDPDEPIDPSYWLESVSSPGDGEAAGKRLVLSTIGLILICLGVVAVNFFGSDFLSKAMLTENLGRLASHPYTFPALVAGFFVLTLVGIPLNLLLVGTALAISPWQAFLAGVIGSHLAAWGGYFAGAYFGRPLYKRYLAQKMRSLNSRLEQGSVIAIAVMRILPVAPFFAINMACGALSVSFRKYVLGTLLGMIPGIFAVTMLSDRVRSVIVDPNWVNGLLVVLACALVLGAVWFLKSMLNQRRPA
jgi:phosphatidylserine/phosphatidylglycerophosphate/cardiolipin synthase-like enzyme/uncharacterized membrane protein YdjX (TVP38/TMEM64 family)